MCSCSAAGSTGNLGIRGDGSFHPCRPDPCGTPADKVKSAFASGPFVKNLLQARGLIPDARRWLERREQLSRFAGAVNAKLPPDFGYKLSSDSLLQWFCQQYLPAQQVIDAAEQVLLYDCFRF